MTIRVAVEHVTEYHYDRAVALSPHVIRLRPAPHSRTPINAYSLSLKPAKHFINWQQDPFGNYLARIVFPEKTRSLIVRVDLVAEMTVFNPFDFFVEDYAEKFPFEYEPALRQDLTPYLVTEDKGPLLDAWLLAVELRPEPVVDFLVGLNQRLQQDISYLIRMEPGVQSCEDTLRLGRGSCRDSGWLLVQILRHLGLAARFVSGYLIQLTADVESLDGPSGPKSDFTDLHAWAEVYIPGAGWIGLDPTSGLFAGEGHIPLACTPAPISAAPITGASDPAETRFEFSNRVTRIHEDPRVTAPYTAAQWRSIDELGAQVDAKLVAEDVRLTMGGEPTFVSIDDMESPQWNTEALGDDKKKLAAALFTRLCDSFAPEGVSHFAQGKWYPGEPVPRWAMSRYWRTDNEPMCMQPHWLAAAPTCTDIDDAKVRDFALALQKRLGLSDRYLIPAFEDESHYQRLHDELPVNLDPTQPPDDDSNLLRLAALLRRGFATPAGYVTPLMWDESAWRSSPWPLPQARLTLIPGDSPIGLRLPLHQLPWTDPAERPQLHERDPFDTTLPLAPVTAQPLPESKSEPSDEESVEPDEILHTALCVEWREGMLHIFMPPVAELEHWLALIQSIEATAEHMQQPVRLEGYPPPRDARLRSFSVTPDPGVIEVNVQPAESWSSLKAITSELYEQARLARLGTEKFMLDGRHTGTGGGNHVTLGGATAADSPLLRRPELLRSLLTCWQQHPALSYVFSGSFIGPTSQAPRVDEARDDNLYELEIAFGQLPAGDTDQPWLIDRMLRNLLVDLTGNTHRAEFCIDKLYSPAGPAGRLGLLEFRGFEMPPHWQMSAVQMLLLRALVARFWNEPLRERLIRWGTALHDRFLLPHFLARDLREVIDDLREHGFSFEHEWFAPFLEFRFPLVGRMSANGIDLEIHSALEPWHVLGEEIASSGMARYVDSSVERLQVRVTGFRPERYALACNGRKVPLHPTGNHGEHVAGIRFKAWQPASGLHPTISVHAPLTFDLIDLRNERSVGGCTYHVAHPGGRNYDTFPLNALEAQARRTARFWEHGQTGGRIQLAEEPASVEYPMTLDLRYLA